MNMFAKDTLSINFMLADKSMQDHRQLALQRKLPLNDIVTERT
jgi:hypothetical protein